MALNLIIIKLVVNNNEQITLIVRANFGSARRHNPPKKISRVHVLTFPNEINNPLNKFKPYLKTSHLP